MERYQKEIKSALQRELSIDNVNRVPGIKKIVVSMGVGSAVQDKKRIEAAARDLAVISGQKAVICKAKKSVSNFKVRIGYPIGCMVTLRSRRMYEFLDRLIALVIPRMRDFRGLSPQAFDGRGNYSLGLAEQTVFPEIDLDKVEFTQGMNVTIVTSAQNDEEGRALLRSFGMPFKN
jgi:large subunit ribosomal protein L5